MSKGVLIGLAAALLAIISGWFVGMMIWVILGFSPANQVGWIESWKELVANAFGAAIGVGGAYLIGAQSNRHMVMSQFRATEAGLLKEEIADAWRCLDNLQNHRTAAVNFNRTLFRIELRMTKPYLKSIHVWRGNMQELNGIASAPLPPEIAIDNPKRNNDGYTPKMMAQLELLLQSKDQLFRALQRTQWAYYGTLELPDDEHEIEISNSMLGTAQEACENFVEHSKVIEKMYAIRISDALDELEGLRADYRAARKPPFPN